MEFKLVTSQLPLQCFTSKLIYKFRDKNKMETIHDNKNVGIVNNDITTMKTRRISKDI